MKRHLMHPYTAYRHGAPHHEEGQEARQPEGGFAEEAAPPEQEGPAHDTAGAPEAAKEAAPGAEAENAQEAGQEDEALARCKAEMEELRLRTAAEMENFKKRLTREHQEQMRFAAERVLGDLLPSLDNLDLALQYGSQHEACKDMLQGVAMTRKLLLDALDKNGLKALGEVGDEFNPEIHEAVGFEPNPDLAPGSVTRVMQRGYKLNDRLLRAAKVMINQ